MRSPNLIKKLIPNSYGKGNSCGCYVQRQALLSECITALRNQSRKPDAILVVNNGSTDNTEQWLQLQSDVNFITQKKCWLKRRFQHRLKLGF
ncbi:MAG: glycosyltransferase [Bacteroidia bacterium]|nr:glycosyltransferase [Bacteroidia bacterium]